MAGYVSTKKSAGIVGSGSYVFELRHNINSERQFLDRATVAFSERNYIVTLCVPLLSSFWLAWQPHFLITNLP
jgi:hypothetical protein